MHKVEQPLRFSQFGSENGRMVIYFHGAPGAPEECGIFDLDGKKHGLTFICFDRFAVDASINGETYYRLLADEISKRAAGKPVDVIGFSIGAFVALQTCRYMPDGVRSLHLVSAAAPLEAGDYLEAMAGKQVFRLATDHMTKHHDLLRQMPDERFPKIHKQLRPALARDSGPTQVRDG